MPKVRKVYVVFAIALLVFSIPIIAFNKTTYAAIETPWEKLTEAICGKSDAANNYDVAQKNECIAGIGMTDSYCSSTFGIQQNKVNACKYAVSKTNINAMAKYTGISFIQNYCTYTHEFAPFYKKYYKCQDDSAWKNDQGYCEITYNNGKFETTVDFLCYKNPGNEAGDEEPEDPDPGDGEEEPGDGEEEDGNDGGSGQPEPGNPGGGGSGTMDDPDGLDEKCEDRSTFGWFLCGSANYITLLVDYLISQFIAPLLQWRVII